MQQGMEGVPFDTDFKLNDLLDSARAEQVVVALAAVLGTPVGLWDAAGRLHAGGAAAGGIRLPLRVSLEPIGALEAATRREALEGARALVEGLLKAELRYRMAAALHTEAVDSDYALLREKHAALQASEARFRDLNQHLEARVKEKMAELETAHRQLYQTEKLAAVGQLAAGVAHEINTPLGYVRSNLNTADGYRGVLHGFYRSQVPEGRTDLEELFDDFKALLEESMVGVDRVARIVAALKDFSCVDRREVAPVDINRIILNALEMVRSTGGRPVEFATELAPLPPVTCNGGQVGQVILSVLTNAVQAIAGKGTVAVRSRAVSKGVTIEIADDGVGIPAAQLTRIFEPFFTTRGVGGGTGLGLTVSHDIVKAHGGMIAVESTQGVGTRVTITLPIEPRGGG